VNWFAETRQNWITECLDIFGYINRFHLEKKFRISPQQASKDLTGYMDKFPDRMRYEPRSKRYEAVK